MDNLDLGSINAERRERLYDVDTPTTPNTSDIIRSLDKFGSVQDNYFQQDEEEDEDEDATGVNDDEITESFEVIDISVPSVNNHSSLPKSDSSFSMTDVLKSG